MVFEIRTAVPKDATGIARVWAAAMPQLVKTARGIEAELRSATGRVVLIAVDGPDVVGYSSLWLPDPDEQSPRVRFALHVPPAVRRSGIGSALFERISAQASEAGAARLLVVVNDDDASKGFASRRGFTIGRQMSHSSADLRATPEPPSVPAGLQVVSFDEIDPQQVWRAVAAVRDDDPSGLSSGLGYDDWLATSWNHPDLRRDLSVAVLDGDEVLSLVSTTADADRHVIWSNLTGTVPAARGRGLAKLVKAVALSRARDAGFETALTGNDAANAPMLAVNQWLGYRVSAAAWTAEKAL
jgi:GNAT superfamily N-acetyltransferase